MERQKVNKENSSMGFKILFFFVQGKKKMTEKRKINCFKIILFLSKKKRKEKIKENSDFKKKSSEYKITGIKVSNMGHFSSLQE